MVPLRPPKSRSRYESDTSGANCVRSTNPVCVVLCERPTLAVASTSGKNAPFAEPYSYAAVRACAHESEVCGLFRSATSTTSASVRLFSRWARSGGSVFFVLVESGSGGTTPCGALYGVPGAGEMAGLPPIEGVVCEQAANTSASAIGARARRMRTPVCNGSAGARRTATRRSATRSSISMKAPRIRWQCARIIRACHTHTAGPGVALSLWALADPVSSARLREDSLAISGRRGRHVRAGERRDGAERGLRGIQSESKILVGIGGVEIGWLVPLRVPAAPDLRATLVLAKADRRHDVHERR